MGGADSFLAGLGPARMVFDLDAFARLLRALGSPQTAFPAIHVAGTNGKGSVCAIAEALLRAHGEHTGLYTSPHLDHPRERIAIDGTPLARAHFEEEVVALRDRIEREAPAAGYSYFDFLTALAFVQFAAARCSVAVVETGLGGRLDSTRLCRPRVACITPIDHDHTAVLGTELTAIAREKAGILRPGVSCVVAPQAEEAERVLEHVAGEQGCELLRLGRDFGAEAVSEKTWRYHPLRGTPVELPRPLPGAHQVANAACAVACVELYLDRPLDGERVATALATLSWPGRLEWIGGCLLDGAHNVAGARALGAYLRQRRSPVRLVWGMLQDKDAAGFLAALQVEPEVVVVPHLTAPRARAPETLVPLLAPTQPYRVVETVAEALEEVASGDAGRTCCVTGSLTLVAEARRHLLTRAPIR